MFWGFTGGLSVSPTVTSYSTTQQAYETGLCLTSACSVPRTGPGMQQGHTYLLMAWALYLTGFLLSFVFVSLVLHALESLS